MMILEESLRNLEVGIRGGGNLVSHRPVFTKDSRHILIVSGDTLQVYSTESADCVGLVQVPSAAAIANVALCSSSSPSLSSNSESQDAAIILTEAGDLLHVSLSTYQITSTQNVNLSLPREWTNIDKWLNIIYLKPGTLLLTGRLENEGETMLYLATKDAESRKAKYRLDKICWNILSTHHGVAAGAGGQLVTAVQKDSVFMTNLASKLVKWHKSGTRMFTCVAAHPHEWLVATGDDSGRILLWRNFLEEKSPAKAVYHWHALPVADLSFSTDGSKLLSGGSECCLVRWDTSDSTDKRILPRMGLPIRHIAVSHGNVLVAVSHADNCIQLIGEGNKITRVIQNITQCYIPDSTEDENIDSKSLGGSSVYEAGLTFDPNRKSLVMNGRPGQLQCYSLLEDKHLYSVDITQQNFMTADRKKVIPNADVSHVAFSSQGVWLATVESLVEQLKYHELRLKFWKFDQAKQLFVLNTSINWPHENGVVSLRIQPGDEEMGLVMAATSGGDKKIRTWGLVHDTSIHGKSEWWTCENVSTYREQEAGPLAFSHDGSVLASAFGNTMTLWKTETHDLSGTLFHSKLTRSIKLAEFSANPTPNLLICSTEKDLIVWDVITLTLMWRVPLAVESLATDSLSNLVAVFSTKQHLYFFKPDAPEPLAVHKSVSRSKITSSIFVANPYASNKVHGLKSMLIFINSSQELCGMQSRDKPGEIQQSAKIRKGSSTLTPFATLIAEKSVSSVQTTGLKSQGTLGIPAAHVIREIMDISPQTKPSISYFFNQFIAAISTQIRVSGRMDSVVGHLEGPKRNDIPSSDDDDSSSDDLDLRIQGPQIDRGLKHEGKEAAVNGVRKDDVNATATSKKHSRVNGAREVKIDLDLVANDDISWIRGGITVTPQVP